jgi:hypothetical protein
MRGYLFKLDHLDDLQKIVNWTWDHDMEYLPVYGRKYPNVEYTCSVCDESYDHLDDIPLQSIDEDNGRVYSCKYKCCKGNRVFRSEGDTYIDGFWVRIIPNMIVVATDLPEHGLDCADDSGYPSHIPSMLPLLEINKHIIYPSSIPDLIYMRFKLLDGEYELSDVHSYWNDIVETLGFHINILKPTFVRHLYDIDICT